MAIPQDVVRASGDEHIPGHVVMNRLTSSRNLLVDGLIDGVNMTHLDQNYLTSLNNHYTNLTFHKSVNVSRMEVTGLFNGFNLDQLYGNSIFASERSVRIGGVKTFTNLFKCNTIQAGLVNGDSLGNYLSLTKPQPGPASVVFTGPTQFANVTLKGSIDGVPVDGLLANAVLLDQAQTMVGSKNFTNGMQIDSNLIVEGTVNGIRPDQFMLYTKNQNITGMNRHIHRARINKLIIDSSLTTQTLNGIDFNALHSRLVPTMDGRPVDLSNMIVYCMNCTVDRLSTHFLNEHNFTEFLKNFMSKTVPQVVSSNIHFENAQHFVDIQTKHGIQGINMKQLQQNAVTLNGYNIIRKPLVIEGDLRLVNGNLNAKLFNNIDIVDFTRKVVYTNNSEVTKIQGTIVFKAGLDLHGNMIVNRLNNVRTEELIMTTNRDYTIKSNVVVMNKVIASKDLNVLGTVNNVDLIDVNSRMLKYNDQRELVGSLNLMHGNVNVSEMNIDGLVNGIKLNRKNIVLINEEQQLRKLVLANHVNFHENINVMSRINSYHKDSLANIVLTASPTRTENQVINASKTFSYIDTLELHQMKGEVHLNIVNGVDLRQFEQQAVYSRHDRILQHKTIFLSNFTVMNPQFHIARLNNISLSTDVVRLDQAKQVITGVKTFDSVTMDQDVTINGNVNGYELKKLANRILYQYGAQHVRTQLNLKAPVYLMSNSTVTAINNHAPEKLVTLHNPQRMQGQVTFHNLVVSQVFTNNKLNGLNLTDMATYALYKDSDHEQSVTQLVVNNATFNQNVQLKYHLNNVDLNVAVDHVRSKMHPEFNPASVKMTMHHLTQELAKQTSQFERANFEIDYLRRSEQTINAASGLDSLAKYRLLINSNAASAGWNIEQLQPLLRNNSRSVQLLWHEQQLMISEIIPWDVQHSLLEIYFLTANPKTIKRVVYKQKIHQCKFS